jgi:hypothetical protein
MDCCRFVCSFLRQVSKLHLQCLGLFIRQTKSHETKLVCQSSTFIESNWLILTRSLSNARCELAVSNSISRTLIRESGELPPSIVPTSLLPAGLPIFRDATKAAFSSWIVCSNSASLACVKSTWQSELASIIFNGRR